MYLQRLQQQGCESPSENNHISRPRILQISLSIRTHHGNFPVKPSQKLTVPTNPKPAHSLTFWSKYRYDFHAGPLKTTDLAKKTILLLIMSNTFLDLYDINRSTEQVTIDNIPRDELTPHRIKINSSRNQNCLRLMGVRRKGTIAEYQYDIGYFRLQLKVLFLDQQYLHAGTHVGRGGFGKVFASDDCIVKVIPHRNKSLPTKELFDVLREIAIAKICSLLGIAPRFDSSMEIDLLVCTDACCFRMEKCTPIRELQVDKRKIQEDLATALRLLHSVQIVHKDIKPDNILWSSKKRKFVLCDFGISRDLDDPIGYKTYTSVEGTLKFMCPEMLALFNKKERGWVDLYFNDYWAASITLKCMDCSYVAVRSEYWSDTLFTARSDVEQSTSQPETATSEKEAAQKQKISKILELKEKGVANPPLANKQQLQKLTTVINCMSELYELANNMPQKILEQNTGEKLEGKALQNFLKDPYANRYRYYEIINRSMELSRNGSPISHDQKVRLYNRLILRNNIVALDLYDVLMESKLLSPESKRRLIEYVLKEQSLGQANSDPFFDNFYYFYKKPKSEMLEFVHNTKQPPERRVLVLYLMFTASFREVLTMDEISPIIQELIGSLPKKDFSFERECLRMVEISLLLPYLPARWQRYKSRFDSLRVAGHPWAEIDALRIKQYLMRNSNCDPKDIAKVNHKLNQVVEKNLLMVNGFDNNSKRAIKILCSRGMIEELQKQRQERAQPTFKGIQSNFGSKESKQARPNPQQPAQFTKTELVDARMHMLRPDIERRIASTLFAIFNGNLYNLQATIKNIKEKAIRSTSCGYLKLEQLLLEIDVVICYIRLMQRLLRHQQALHLIEQAESFLQSLAGFRQNNQQHSAKILYLKATSQLALHQYQYARSNAKTALEQQFKTFGKENLDFASIQLVLAQSYIGLEKYEEASRHLVKCEEVYKQQSYVQKLDVVYQLNARIAYEQSKWKRCLSERTRCVKVLNIIKWVPKQPQNSIPAHPTKFYGWIRAANMIAQAQKVARACSHEKLMSGLLRLDIMMEGLLMERFCPKVGFTMEDRPETLQNFCLRVRELPPLYHAKAYMLKHKIKKSLPMNHKNNYSCQVLHLRLELQLRVHASYGNRWFSKTKLCPTEKPTNKLQ